MHLLAPALLFLLNLCDGLMTLVWVRSGVATEANSLMAGLLEMGDWPFLLVKIGMGTFASVVLYIGRDRPLAKYGIGLALTLYIGLMGLHFFTGLSAFGLVSSSQLKDLLEFPGQISALIT
jgi:hypothetical protein